MKKIAFVSRRKMVAQGLKAAMAAGPCPSLGLLPLIAPQHARQDLCIYEPDIIILDIAQDMDREGLFSLCRDLREGVPGCRVLLLIPEEEPRLQELFIEARTLGLADDFVFYDNSMDYLLAKLTAL